MKRRNAEYRCAFVVLLMTLALSFASGATATEWVVAKTADDGSAGTLRHAIANSAYGDTIVFSGDLGITLTQGYIVIPNRKMVTITGPATITGANETAVFYIYGRAVLKNLTFVGGDSWGAVNTVDTWEGSLSWGGKATISDCTFRDNGCGSGVYNESLSTMKLTNCRMTNNTHTSDSGGGARNDGTMEMTGCLIDNNRVEMGFGGGVFNMGTLTMSGCTVRNNDAGDFDGGGIKNTRTLSLVQGCAVYGNTPDQINGPYTADASCSIGVAPNAKATSLDGFVGGAEPEPRDTEGEEDVNEVVRDLADPANALSGALAAALSRDLGKSPSNVSATLHYANTFEDVAVTSRDLAVEYTASWPENVRYYALFARSDGTGYELADRGVQFELHAGQDLPAGVTPPDFYVAGEGLMTWRNVVTDNGSYDLNPTAGVVTFRVCSVRVVEATGDKGSSGGCDAGVGNGAAFLLLLCAPLCVCFRATERK